MQRWSPKGRPWPRGDILNHLRPFPWPREVLFSEGLSLASDYFCVLGLEFCVLNSTSGIMFSSMLYVGAKVFFEVGIELEKRVKSVLLLCFAFFTLLFSSIGLFDEDLGRKGEIGLAGPAPE